jgi:hypothetical protein
VNAADTLELIYEDGGYYVGGNSGQSATQQYFQSDSSGYCYYQQLAAAGNALSSFGGRSMCVDSPFSGTAVHRITGIGQRGKLPVPAIKLIGPLVHKAHPVTHPVVVKSPVVVTPSKAVTTTAPVDLVR